MTEKNKMGFHEQIQKMNNKGINFNIVTTRDAYSQLQKNTYFYKLYYFRKIYNKNINGEYGIEFAHLTDLARIDMELRYLLLHMCLDIEHSIKTVLNKQITNDPNEDGYNIISNFLNETRVSKDDIFKYQMKNNKIRDEYKNYYEKPAFWVCFEIMTYNSFVQFVEYYYSKTKYGKIKYASNTLRYAKNIRNKCAHNSVLIVPLDKTWNFPKELQSILKNKQILTRGKHAKILVDITAVILLHERYCSNNVKRRTAVKLNHLNNSICKNLDLYKYNTKNDKVYDFIKNLSKIIDTYLK